MKNTLAIIINKSISLVCKILKPILKKDGSVTPGYYASKLNKKILNDLKYPKYIIGITGSSGKGSTVSLVAHILENNGYKVVWNKSGSNLYNAAVTLLLNHTNPFTKKIKADILLMELDESYITSIFDKVKLTHLLITNITRDQPARNGHVDLIIDKIASSFDDSTHILINADDPIVAKLKLKHKGQITTYGIEKTKYSIKNPISNNLDSCYCPNCNSLLKYKYYHYGHIGDYSCSNCDFKRGNVNFSANDVNLEKQFMTINDEIVHLNKNVFFACYYTLSAYTICKTIGLTSEQINKQLNENVMQSKRLKTYKIDNRIINMLESKNENALSYIQSINYIINEPDKKTVIMGFENVSRRYKQNDLSWLYDVDFDLLRDSSIDKIFVIGRFKYDVINRLKYAKIDDKKIILIDDMNDLIPTLKKKSKGNIYTMVCFDMTAIIKKLLEGEK